MASPDTIILLLEDYNAAIEGRETPVAARCVRPRTREV